MAEGQQEEFDTIISFLDHMQLELAAYLQKYLEEFKRFYSESGYQDVMLAVMCRLSRAYAKHF